MRKVLLFAVLLLFLAGFNFSAMQKEKLMHDGTVMYLKLAPRDPRALLLGDYMALNFDIDRVVDNALRDREKDIKDNPPREGAVFVTLDAQGVASFSRLDDGAPPARGEYRLRYRLDKRRPRVTAASFFFQEGHAKDYDEAKYGEIHADADGGNLLTHLLDENLQRIKPAKRPPDNGPDAGGEDGDEEE